MSRFDRSTETQPPPRASRAAHLDLDGHLLQLLVAVHEEGSITRAAQRLGVTQSAVSHLLDKLRGIVGDPLFVKSGRGIVPTAMADLLAQRARALLGELRAFSLAAGFEPARLAADFTIAANDLQRDLLLPALLRRLRAEAPDVTLRVIPSGAPEAAMLRDESCQLVITPRPPDGSDILQKRLFEDRYRVFFDPAQRAAPVDAADYLAAEHITVLYEPRRSLDLDLWLAARGVQRRLIASVPGMAGLAAMLRGGPWLATAPSLLAAGALQGLASSDVPVETPTMPMYLVWHQRLQDDPVHRWLRAHIEAVVADAGLRGPDAAPPTPQPA
ncbi:MAG TPA: LysR family transcriptional regulator [Burkholderiaceae bacterium]|nr:LysR family transcriptional regulator [Burkholderiaceae bacterium]HMX12327.1 LysR family transcriptional regulator [Burkholderiaceae bacterium]HMY98935.1 LysR family transcriptional regulator [Burkholderiaceae bacterium]HNG82886.1 LysR family transcriptional regulator [Burkholderiaceae bacterium]